MRALQTLTNHLASSVWHRITANGSPCLGSLAQASVAAPMTSKAQTIASMITVVAEGRCTLMATYQIFQFIIAYALVQVSRRHFL